jgi:hypothetical protein
MFPDSTARLEWTKSFFRCTLVVMDGYFPVINSM